METKKLKNFIKKNYSYDDLFNCLTENYSGHYDYYDLVGRGYDYLLDLLIDLANNHRDDILQILKNKKQEYECK